MDGRTDFDMADDLKQRQNEVSDFQDLMNFARSQKPGPVQNFDLVFFSPQYTDKMYKILDQNICELKDSELKNLQNYFDDWSQMDIKQDIISNLQESLT